ncbi:hypothetical protein CANMA_003308 [Candida margitis]|uniref:uncharacterized protein n=1 Tax=Candida margitis TaxID=1775924 RepID=UPI0022276F3B|nr:uncharacterized protein CANMA_003308 [Candida margitis]KAI5966062.1 hypothetical protein CANMA_003308 [Candida margitis]
MVRLKLQILLIPEECSSLPTSKIDSLIAKKFLHLIDPAKKIGELLDAIIAQFQRLYPDESVISIVKCQDKNQCDLDKDYQVDDVFESNDEVRVIVDNLFFSDSFEKAAPTPIKRSREEMESLPAVELVGATPTKTYSQPASSPVSLAPPEAPSSTKIPKKKMTESPGAKSRQRITSGMLVKPPTASPPANNSEDDDFSVLEANPMEDSSESEDDVPINKVNSQTQKLAKADILDMYKKQSEKNPLSKREAVLKSLHIDTVEGHPYIPTSNHHEPSTIEPTKDYDKTPKPAPVTSTPATTKRTSPTRQQGNQLTPTPTSTPAGVKVTLAYKKKSDLEAASAPNEVKETPRKGRSTRAKKMTSSTTTTTATASPAPIERVYDESKTINILDSIDFRLGHLSDQILKYKTGPNGTFKQIPKHFAVGAYTCESVYTDPVVDFRFDLSGESSYSGPLPYKVKTRTQFDRENGVKTKKPADQNPFNSQGLDDIEYDETEVIKISSGSDDEDNEDERLTHEEDKAKTHEEEESIEESIKAPKRKAPPKPQATTSSNASRTRANPMGPLPKHPPAMNDDDSPDGRVIKDHFKDTKSKKKDDKESDAKVANTKQGATNAKKLPLPKRTPKKVTKKKKGENDSDDDSGHEAEQGPKTSKSKFEAMSSLFALGPVEKNPREKSIETDEHVEHKQDSTSVNEVKSVRNQENENLESESENGGQQQSTSRFNSFYNNSKKATEATLGNLFYGESKSESDNKPVSDTLMDSHFGSADPSVLRRSDNTAFGVGSSPTKGKPDQHQDGNGTVKANENGAVGSVEVSSTMMTSLKFPSRSLPTSLGGPDQRTGSQSLQLYAANQGEEQGSSSGSSDIESVAGDDEDEEMEAKTAEKRLVASEPIKRNASPGVNGNSSQLSTLRLLTSIANKGLTGALEKRGVNQVTTNDENSSKTEELTRVRLQNGGGSKESLSTGDNGAGASSMPLATPARKPTLPTLTELGSRGIPEVKDIDDLKSHKEDKKTRSSNIDASKDESDVKSAVDTSGEDSSLSSSSSDDDEEDDSSGNELFLSNNELKNNKRYNKSVRAKKNLFTR